eukprot:3626377-Rhodomonas_salina.1
MLAAPLVLRLRYAMSEVEALRIERRARCETARNQSQTALFSLHVSAGTTSTFAVVPVSYTHLTLPTICSV